VPPAGVVVAAVNRDVRITRYWTPHPAANAPQRLSEAADRFRERFTECVRTRIDAYPSTWSDLSGGLDSSSIVVTAHHLAQRGDAPPLAGTMTYVDRFGEADERPFSDAVIAQVGLPQLLLDEEWPWRDDGEPPPLSDEPSPFFPFFARERRGERAIYRAGGRVLLGGMGSDHYLTGSPMWLADLVRAGRMIEAARGCAAVGAALRTSMWRAARRHAIEPLLPLALRYACVRAEYRLPAWIPKAFVRRYDMRDSLWFMRIGRQGMPTRFQDAIAIELEAIDAILRFKVSEQPIELRFPFLDRALVELALGGPRDHVCEPGVTKVVLREAMRGRLPETVRQRSTKGGIDARILWALTHERERIDTLIRQSCLADLGAIDPKSLQRAVDEARQGHTPNPAYLLSVLALETWLAVKHDRWRIGDPAHRQSYSDAA